MRKSASTCREESIPFFSLLWTFSRSISFGFVSSLSFSFFSSFSLCFSFFFFFCFSFFFFSVFFFLSSFIFLGICRDQQHYRSESAVVRTSAASGPVRSMSIGSACAESQEHSRNEKNGVCVCFFFVFTCETDRWSFPFASYPELSWQQEEDAAVRSSTLPSMRVSIREREREKKKRRRCH